MSKRYELSLWRDYPGATEIREEKTTILATTGMDYSGRAQNIVLSPSYTGEVNLTFELPVKYFDPFSGSWIINPLAEKVQVKSKLKLWRNEHWYNKYANPVYDTNVEKWNFTPQWEDGRWYDFIVNSRTEKRSKKKISYEFSCVSLFVNELSRTGYSLEFKSDSTNINENSIGTAHQLAEKITADTDWQYIKSEVFPDYKSIFNSTTGEIEKIPVKTDQIEFLDGLKQYDYCYNYAPNATVMETLSRAKKNGYIVDGQAGADANSFWWYKSKDDIGQESKKKTYIYGHNKDEFITAYAEKYVAEESGMYADYGYTGISTMSDLSGGWVNDNHKDLGIGSTKTGDGLGTVSPIRYYRTLDFSLYDTYYNLSGENTRLPCGTLLNVQVAGAPSQTETLYSFQIYEGKNWSADEKYESPLFSFSINVKPQNNTDSPYTNSYYIRVPQTVEQPHFALRSQSSSKSMISLSSFLVYKMVGYNETNNEKLLNVSSYGQISSLSSYFPSGYNVAENKDDTGNPIWLPLGKITVSDYTKEQYEYLIETYNDGTYHQIYLPARENEVSKISAYNVDKRRAISGEKSNRFSLLTTVCETFKCFFKFIVLHDEDGSIKKVNGLPAKYYTLVSTLGNEQFSGFTYGVNLDEVSRQVDATNLVSKLYVENIDNQYKDKGLVSITQSSYNELKENFIYNFGYYLLRGLIDRKTFNIDYESMRNIVYENNTKLETLNNEYLKIKDKKFELDNEVYTLKAVNNSLVSTVDKCLEDINWAALLNYRAIDASSLSLMCVATRILSTFDTENVGEDFEPLPYTLTSSSGTDHTLYARRINGEVLFYQKLSNNSYQQLTKTNKTATNWDDNSQLTEITCFNGSIYIRKNQKFPNIDISNMVAVIVHGPRLEFKDLSKFVNIAEFEYNSKYYIQNSKYDQICGLKQETIVNTLETVAAYQSKYKQYLNTITLDEEALNGENGYNAQLAAKETEINSLIAEKNQAISNFEKKYSQYVIEGTWSGDDYVDDDVYYLDATQISAESCMPKVEYTVSALDLSKLTNPLDPTDINWGKEFFYDVGDTTYIKDQELFGATENTVIEQKSMIATKDIYIDVDKPDNIELRNYDTRFEELFQSIQAAVISLKYNENIYGRAANFTPQGTIDTTILQKSFDANKDLVMSSNNEKVVSDRYGITVKDADDNSGNVLRIVAGGILLSKDNGLNYTTGITAEGINGELITAGQVDTSKVVIRSSDTPALQLDELGLTAYRNYNATYDSNGKMTSIANPIVRHDQFGFYLARKGDSFGKDWFSKIGESLEPENYIEQNSDISITQLGISLQSEDGEALKLINNIRTLNIAGEDKQWGSCIGSFTNNDAGELLPRVRLGYIRTDEEKGKIHGLDIYGGCLRIYGKNYDEITDETDDTEASLFFSNETLNLNGDLIRKDTSGGSVKIGNYGGDLVFSSGYEMGKDDYSSITLTQQIDTNAYKLGIGVQATQTEESASISYLFPHNNLHSKVRTLYINSGYIDSLDNSTPNGANLCIQAGRFKVDTESSPMVTMEHFARIDMSGNNTEQGSINIEGDYITVNGTPIDSTGSDLSIKHDVKDLDDRYSLLFDKLRPVSFIYDKGQYGYGASQRTHTGFIANEVEQALTECGLTTQDFAGYLQQKDGLRCLRYEEFIPLAIAEIQKLKKEIQDLKSKLS